MTRIACFVAFIAVAVLAPSAGAGDIDEPTYYDYRIVNQHPHDTKAFTQGLFIDDGALYETTGQYGASGLRKTDLQTGEVLQSVSLPERLFGEGAVVWDDDVIMLTWRSGKGFVFDQQTFERERSFTYDGEGWGLTQDGARLIMSDGTDELRFLDPNTLEETGRLSVTFRGKALPNLNELEWINGEIFANVWQSDAIVRINPDSGVVTGVIDLRGLLSDEDRAAGADVLNGVAYDAETNRLFVTGKYWPTLFEIELAEKQLHAPTP